jgi:hypothetical protein
LLDNGDRVQFPKRRFEIKNQKDGYLQKKLALTSLTSGGRSVGIVRLRTEATECFERWIIAENKLLY